MFCIATEHSVKGGSQCEQTELNLRNSSSNRIFGRGASSHGPPSKEADSTTAENASTHCNTSPNVLQYQATPDGRERSDLPDQPFTLRPQLNTEPLPSRSVVSVSRPICDKSAIHEAALGEVAILPADVEPHDDPLFESGSLCSCIDQSPVLKPLLRTWFFSSDRPCSKSSPGALEGYTQSQFEHLVTAGFILEDHRGLRWVSNDRFILFHSNEPGDEEAEHTSTSIQPRYMDAKSLFSEPQSTVPAHTPSTQISPNFNSTAPNTNDTRPLYKRRGILKLLDSDPQNPAPPIPLTEPWHFPPQALYKEAYPNATHNLSHTKLEALVTRGVLVASPTGLRDAGTDTHHLLYIGERDECAKQYVPRIAKFKECPGEVVLEEKLPTPIVEEAEGEAWRTGRGGGGEMGTARMKKVRFSWRCKALDARGWACSEELSDKEGKK